MDGAGTRLEQYQRAGQPLTMQGDGRIWDTSQTSPPLEAEPSYPHASLNTVTALSLFHWLMQVKKFSGQKSCHATDGGLTWWHFIISKWCKEKKKSSVENDSVLNGVCNCHVCELRAGRIFFCKRFLFLFQSRHFQERQTEDSERGGSWRELQNSANKHYRPKASPWQIPGNL